MIYDLFIGLILLFIYKKFIQLHKLLKSPSQSLSIEQVLELKDKK